MRICLLGKYPPLQGQVSTIAYCLARGLAERGHEVHVVTNTQEATRFHRTDCSILGPAPPPWGSSNVYVHYTAVDSPGDFYIPYASPFVSKLASLAVKVVADFGLEIVLSNYLEPYAVSAFLTSQICKIPHVATHAGSDVQRFGLGSGQDFYRHIVRSANFVARTRAARKLLDTSTDQSSPQPFIPPNSLFNRNVLPMDIGELIRLNEGYIREDLGWHADSLPLNTPIIAFYGKLLKTRAIEPALSALNQLRARGHSFALLFLSRWHRGEDAWRELVRAKGLADRTWFLPFLPIHAIPSFLRACQAVCHIEHLWPGSPHISICPLEIMSIGSSVGVFSKEALDSAWYRPRFKNEVNCLVVEDPSKVDELAGAFCAALFDNSFRDRVARETVTTQNAMPKFEDFVASWERLLFRALS